MEEVKLSYSPLQSCPVINPLFHLSMPYSTRVFLSAILSKISLSVIIVEDIADTGKTLHYLVQQSSYMNPKTIQICVFLDKPSKRTIPVKIDYIGHTIEDLFVVGYGMDFEEKFRNLPYIAMLD